MKKIIIAFPLLVLIACANNAKQKVTDISSETVHNSNADTIITSAQPIILNGCYQMKMKKDSATLQLHVQDSLVTGTLEYKLSEKDALKGTINGKLKDNLIIADYNFSSEGTTSTREVVFKINESFLFPGFGKIKDSSNSVVFENINTLQYDSIHPFVKVPCL